MTPVMLQPAAPRSRVKHSTTEPLRSLSMEGNRPELKCLQRLSVEKTLANEDKILHFMAFDIISLILSRVCLASICQFLFLTIFV